MKFPIAKSRLSRNPKFSKLLLTNSRNRNSTLELLLTAFLIKIIPGHTISLFFPINIFDSASFLPPHCSPPFASHTLHFKFCILFSDQDKLISNIPGLKVFKKEKTKTKKLLSHMTGFLHILSGWWVIHC